MIKRGISNFSKEIGRELTFEPHLISMSIFRLLTFGGYVISAGWIVSGSNWSFYSILAGIACVFLLIKMPIELGKMLTKKNTLKLVLLRVWIVLLVGMMAYGSIGSIHLLMLDGFEKLGATQSNVYHYWKSIGDLYFDLIVPIVGLLSTLHIKHTIKKWKRTFGPVFPSLAWI